MKHTSFSLASMPLLHAGVGKTSVLTDILKSYGRNILVITGARSFNASKAHTELFEIIRHNSTTYHQYSVDREPSPGIIDAAVQAFGDVRPDVVIGVGGGSVLDAAKAISAMLPLKEPVKDYLEGVGSKSAHPGTKTPFIALPTTSGTGSETTRNAVLSEVGEQGYKRSLRHANFVSNVTILDPQLMVTCPQPVTAYSGMDAFTQLLESYLSTAGNAATDMIAIEGLRLVSSSLIQAYGDGADLNARAGMALAAYLSGITLTNAGLGLIHGLAAVIGGRKEIPHGVICSALMAPSNKVTVRKLRQTASSHPAISKYSTTGKLFCDTENRSEAYYIDHLLDLIEKWTLEMEIPKLASFGINSDDIKRFAVMGENKNNPIALNRDEIVEVLEMAL